MKYEPIFSYIYGILIFLRSMLRVINISNDCLKSFIVGPINHEFDQQDIVWISQSTFIVVLTLNFICCKYDINKTPNKPLWGPFDKSPL